MTRSLVEMAMDLVMMQLRVSPCSTEVIDELLHTTHATLLDLSLKEAEQLAKEKQKINLSETLASLQQRPLATLQQAQVICLECGQAYRLLSSTHLILHGLTAKNYRKKWGLPPRQSLSAKSLTQRRRQGARGRDAGQFLAAWRAQRHQQSE